MLLDSGNLVLKNIIKGDILWQSFDTPTDTFLPGMTVSTTLTLTSWKSPQDPSVGGFLFMAADPLTNNTYDIWNGTNTTWRSNVSKNNFDENETLSDAFISLLSNTFTKQQQPVVLRNGTRDENYSVIENDTRLVMSYSGSIQYFSWPKTNKNWVLEWEEPNNCSAYKACGPFGICNAKNNTQPCSCLSGFEPISSDYYKDGCRRTSEICQTSPIDTFINISMISIDNTSVPFYPSKNESDCIKKCLEDCKCLAYTYRSQEEGSNATQGCWFWNSTLYNLEMHGRHNIFFRVSYSKGKSTSHKRVPTVAVVISALVLLSSFSGISYFAYIRLVNTNSNNRRNAESMSIPIRKYIRDVFQLDDSREENTEGIDVPYFELETLIAATSDFSEENRLGQGGFGPVFKGKLPGGQEIAVKRLASLSGQGLQEFKNEIILIAKLQHRNLVKLIGYSIRGEEKMLLYEYLPNRSLDLFIFDQTLCISLDWEMRFNIIMGIARGLNYLHHDSRLRIIHRDLKTSNILLDEDMNPKISDFGLAKIIKGKEIEAITNRVVGTFGYMSPEYALDGLFSIKSDVFSFGVVLLEILSGKRNTGFYQIEKNISLLGYAWNLWTEDKPLELIDHTLMKSCNSSELLKCITIGLLCVQQDPDDRPTMTNVLGMLGGDITTLPTPKEPAFIIRRDQLQAIDSSSSSSSKPNMQTKNMLTITELDPR
uniref:G-type lectin S-receptor-like serine/threonine-protein kinase At4g03230 n=1 Tax=Erigeron canadensis TaxID=72917 RepID=UPI001CB9186E|nr:G-type lectin S-receptor-like serine/threonine-protein kinase At4g03230 [Erigeron canadensis]